MDDCKLIMLIFGGKTQKKKFSFSYQFCRQRSIIFLGFFFYSVSVAYFYFPFQLSAANMKFIWKKKLSNTQNYTHHWTNEFILSNSSIILTDEIYWIPKHHTWFTLVSCTHTQLLFIRWLFFYMLFEQNECTWGFCARNLINSVCPNIDSIFTFYQIVSFGFGFI